MTSKMNMLAFLQNKNDGLVTFGYNNKWQVIGIANIGQGKKILTKNILLLDGLKHIVNYGIEIIMIYLTKMYVTYMI